MVSVPAWVVMEAEQVVAEVRRETSDARPDRAGMLDAVRRVMSSQGRATLEAAGFPSEPGEVRGSGVRFGSGQQTGHGRRSGTSTRAARCGRSSSWTFTGTGLLP